MKEREISLVDLLVEILLHWRGIIVLMLVGGICLGAFSYMRSVQSAQAQAARIEELKEELEEGTEGGMRLTDVLRDYAGDDEADMEEIIGDLLKNDNMSLEEALKARLEEEMTEAQLNNVYYTLRYEEKHRDKELRQKESVIMQMDPDNVQKAEITFIVNTGDPEKAYDIERVYEDLGSSTEFMEKLAEQSGQTLFAIGEIYSLSRGSSGPMKGSNTFRVVISHYDEKTCRLLADTVIEEISARHDELAGQVGEHEVAVLTQSFGPVTNPNVRQRQQDAVDELLDLEAASARLKAAFSEEEWYYYNLLATGELGGNPNAIPVDKTDTEAEEEEENIRDIIEAGVTVRPGVSVKYVLLGMIMAAFVYAFAVFMLYVLNNKLRATDHLQELYEIPQLGQIPDESSDRKVFGFIDKWILRLRYWNQRKFTPEEALNLTAVAIKMAAGKEALDTVCLIGCDLKAQALKNCGEIKDFLEKEKIGVRILNNVLYDAEAMRELEDARGVVLVEKAGSTLYTEVAQELELLNRQEIRVLGGVIVG